MILIPRKHLFLHDLITFIEDLLRRSEVDEFPLDEILARGILMLFLLIVEIILSIVIFLIVEMLLAQLKTLDCECVFLLLSDYCLCCR